MIKPYLCKKKVVKKHFKQLSSALGNPEMLCQFYNTSLFLAETHLSSNWFQSIAKGGDTIAEKPWLPQNTSQLSADLITSKK